MRFVKMEGLGNDYIYLNCLDWEPKELPSLARRLSDRHFGIGADGLICIRPGKTGDFTMEMYNADGSRGTMCGNGIRCVGKYVRDAGLTQKERLVIDTDAGPRLLELHLTGGTVDTVTVDMGEVTLGTAVTLEAAGQRFRVVPARAGNPHGVILCQNPEKVDLETLGPVLETHPALGGRSNIEFVSCPGWEELRVRVWERGSGITLACGTGACAAFAVVRGAGLCAQRVSALLPGGRLELELRENRVFMTGPARTVFRGEVEL